MTSIRLGCFQTLPVALSVFAYGMVYGLLTLEADMSLLEATFSSGLIFAGSSQLVVLDLWTHPLPIIVLIFTTLIVNIRHVLMGASLSPWLTSVPQRLSFPLLFFMVDESWALTLGAVSKGAADIGYLLGSGVLLWFTWMGATLTGRFVGFAIPNPEQVGLDFAFTAVFLVLLAGLWKSKDDIPAWLVAATTSLIVYHFFPGKWYIVAGGLAGSLTGLWKCHEDR